MAASLNRVEEAAGNKVATHSLRGYSLGEGRTAQVSTVVPQYELDLDLDLDLAPLV